MPGMLVLVEAIVGGDVKKSVIELLRIFDYDLKIDGTEYLTRRYFSNADKKGSSCKSFYDDDAKAHATN